MPKILNDYRFEKPKQDGLRTHQIRLLRTLAAANGPLSRVFLAEYSGLSPTVVSRALGYEDPERRKQFEETNASGGFPSLITLEFVEALELDLDGVKEIAYSLTPAGERAHKATLDQYLPPPNK